MRVAIRSSSFRFLRGPEIEAIELRTARERNRYCDHAPRRGMFLHPALAGFEFHSGSTFAGHTGEGGCCKKYVILCCLCGGLSAAVGCLFLAVHAVLSAHTASLALFETVPSYIPGVMVRDKDRSRSRYYQNCLNARALACLAVRLISAVLRENQLTRRRTQTRGLWRSKPV